MTKSASVTVIASDKSWIEGEAVRQLGTAASLPGMVRAVGLPDLHPGKGIPVGAAFLCDGHIYPHLVGNDIGCGMGLWQSDVPVGRLKMDKLVKRMHGLEESWDGDAETVLAERGLPADLASHALGTIGGGNHFAELQKVEHVEDTARFAQLGLKGDKVALLVHSGSRGLGEAILRRHVDQFAGSSLRSDSPDAQVYLSAHNQAVTWAEVNRVVIARRVLERLGGSARHILDVCHNSVTAEDGGWLHRKGAASARQGPVVIPGSRGAMSYLVEPSKDCSAALWSLAHGAGRKWKRSDAKARLSHKYSAEDLARTKLGGRVICEDRALIYEEAPEAYKSIESVIDDLNHAGLVRIIATYRPILTYKTRRV